MCVINITLNSTTPQGTSITSATGRYRINGTTTWNSFSISLTNPKTPNITTRGLYELEVNVTNNIGVTSDWATSTFQVAGICPDIVVTPLAIKYSYQGVYSNPDPVHPNGGQVRYLDANGIEQLRQFIWSDDCVTISATEILQTIGVGPCETTTPFILPTSSTVTNTNCFSHKCVTITPPNGGSSVVTITKTGIGSWYGGSSCSNSTVVLGNRTETITSPKTYSIGVDAATGNLGATTTITISVQGGGSATLSRTHSSPVQNC